MTEITFGTIAFKTDVQAKLEAMIDKSSVEYVLAAIGQICVEKCDHVRSNWQDETLARAWESLGERLDGFDTDGL